MRFGGHETFTIRPGWLSKGLRHVEAEPAAPFDRLEVIDALGVGRNMGRSIWHWLQVTGLAERQGDQMALTGPGRLIAERDPFLQHAASWWAIHVALVTQPNAAVAWSWFFGEFDRKPLRSPDLRRRAAARPAPPWRASAIGEDPEP